MSHTQGTPLSTTIPTDAQVPYTAPSIPSLLSLLAYLTLLASPTLLSNAFQHPEFSSNTSSNEVNDSTAIYDATKSNASINRASYTLNAGLTLIIPLLLGALFGPSITSNSILSTSTQRSLMDIGYIGVLLLIFEAGVSLDSTSLKLMRSNAGLSTLAALTGVLVPIALSMGIGMGAFGYSCLQAFASGASLSSTSVGTTLVLLSSSSVIVTGKDGPQRMELRKTRVGCVLVCAALLDDIIGLVIAGIIPGLAQSESGGGAQIRWPVIVRPILVSFAFGAGTPVAAKSLRWIIGLPWKDTWHKIPRLLNTRRHGHGATTTSRRSSHSGPRPQVLFVFIILALMSFVAGSAYAGTSELFGAYLAGTFVGYVFEEKADPTNSTDRLNNSPSTSIVANIPLDDLHVGESGWNPAHIAFTAYLQPILVHLLAPLFFASIGAALPIKEMFATHPNAVQVSFTDSASVAGIVNGKASHRVVWRGLVYSVLMVLGKMVVGIWMFVWPDPNAKQRLLQRPNAVRRAFMYLKKLLAVRSLNGLKLALSRQNFQDPNAAWRQEDDSSASISASAELSPMRSALLLGLAMVARGEIALIVAQLARPLLVETAAPSATSTSSMGSETVTSTITPIPDEEPFAVVIWAILVSTVGGALGVGALIASWERKDRMEVVKNQVDASPRASIPTDDILDRKEATSKDDNAETSQLSVV
ncbi:hypothetical protein BDN70DRAFT_882884 [Pholiota conissans]|uniref:Cation/H+ exchanger transmembrane domain-containing protein n=1 Tax=Pholiota conissans TaxID=109636 RepID=A0A9P5YVT9_9AGAR|nr:hypothetical protein BDN70DRAFT_882884 [Pholiota conissans]